MPDVRPVDAVQDEVGKRDRVDEVRLLATEERVLAQGAQVLRGCIRPEAVAHVLERLREEAPGAATRVIDGLADLRVDGADHRPDDLARGEELAAVVVLLAHLEQQAFVGLAEGEQVGLVDGFEVDLVDAIEDVEEIALRVDVHLVDRGHDLADDLVPRRRTRLIPEPTQVREQVPVDEREVRTHGAVGELGALGSAGRGPVPPPVRRSERWGEHRPDRLCLLGLKLLALVEDPEEQDPGQLRDVLEGTHVVGAPHDVRDLLDRSVEPTTGWSGVEGRW